MWRNYSNYLCLQSRPTDGSMGGGSGVMIGITPFKNRREPTISPSGVAT